MKKIQTNSFRKASSSKKNLFRLSQSMFGGENSIDIFIDDIEMSNGIFAVVEGTAFVDPVTRDPGDHITPPSNLGGDYSSAGDCRVSFFDTTGEPVMPDGSPNLEQRDFDLDELKNGMMLSSIDITKLEGLIEHQASMKGQDQDPFEEERRLEDERGDREYSMELEMDRKRDERAENGLDIR